MQPNDKPKFLAVLNGLAAIKPGAKLTAEALTLYWNALAAWSIEDFSAAAAQLARTSEFMPNPYHFEMLRKAGRLTAGEAWAQVLDYVRNSGYNQWECGLPTLNAEYPQITDQLVNAAVRAIGGYRAVAMSNTEQTQFLERRFAEHFESIRDAEDVREALPLLTGGTKHSDPKLSAPVRMLLNGLANKP